MRLKIMVRVAHLTSVHPRYDTRIFIKMCGSLAHNGYDVALIVADGKGDEAKNGVQIYDVGSSGGGRLSRMIFTVDRVFSKAKVLDVEVYHLHDPELMPVEESYKRWGKSYL